MKPAAILALVATLALAGLARGQQQFGQVTHLPIPRFVSLKSATANVRRGPSLSNRIDWVFRHRGTPLIVRAEYGTWFRVEDAEGEGGWVHTRLLSNRRTVLVQQARLPLREAPRADAAPLALLEAGVLPRLNACLPDWCRVSIEGYSGWLPKAGIWGVTPEEVFE